MVQNCGSTPAALRPCRCRKINASTGAPVGMSPSSATVCSLVPDAEENADEISRVAACDTRSGCMRWPHARLLPFPANLDLPVSRTLTSPRDSA